MSTRSRAAPWFIDRPELFYRPPRFTITPRDRALAASAPVKAWLEEVTRIITQHITHEWSWNGRDWFDARGNVVEHGPLTRAFLDTIEREARNAFEPAYADDFTGLLS